MPNGTGQGDPHSVASGAADRARELEKRVQVLEKQIAQLQAVVERVLKSMEIGAAFPGDVAWIEPPRDWHQYANERIKKALAAERKRNGDE